MRVLCGSRRPRSGGFTLVELLVVIAGFALLAALLIPVLARARERVWQIRCLSHIQQITKAHLLYLQDWDEQLPDWWQHAPPRPEPYRARRYWTEYLLPYLRSEAIFHDPSFSWPAAPPQGARLADYALFTWGPGGSGWPSDPSWRWAGPPLSLSQVKRPAETVSLTDGYTTTEITRGHVVRHREGMNAGFLDGHAKWLTREQAFAVTHDQQGSYQHETWYFYRFSSADR
jgi:prepilin-type processing-associated H-X9-DG protein